MLNANEREPISTRSVELGFAQPGEPVGRPKRAYDLGAYASREREAIEMFASFSAPDHYAMPRASPAAECMLDSRDLALQARYREDPAALFREPPYAALTDRAQLLAIAHSLAINAALAEPAAT